MSASIPLSDTLRKDYLRLPNEVMKKSGPAAQTMGAILALMDSLGKQQAFPSAGRICKISGLALGTTRDHLKRLAADGWLENLGRDRLGRSGEYLRRTCTRRLTEAAVACDRKFGCLPRWAIEGPAARSSWAERAVLASLCAFENLTQIEHDGEYPAYGGTGWFTISRIANRTGLSVRRAREAADRLAAMGCVDFVGGEKLGEAKKYRLISEREVTAEQIGQKAFGVHYVAIDWTPEVTVTTEIAVETVPETVQVTSSVGGCDNSSTGVGQSQQGGVTISESSSDNPITLFNGTTLEEPLERKVLMECPRGNVSEPLRVPRDAIACVPDESLRPRKPEPLVKAPPAKPPLEGPALEQRRDALLDALARYRLDPAKVAQ